MKIFIKTVLIFELLLLLSACGSGESQTFTKNDSTDSKNSPDLYSSADANSLLDTKTFQTVSEQIPTLVVIMNWNNYSENDSKIWHDKIFDYESNSVNRWYYDATDAKIGFVPVKESSGTQNDGVIIVNMNKNHPGGADDYSFRDVEIKNAIKSPTVVNNVDFASLDLDGDKNLNHKELQIIFVVAGGEESYGDSTSNSIWAHAWSFDANAPLVDGVTVMKYTGNLQTSGWYVKFGATHSIGNFDQHKATVGIIAHELGHATLDLVDLYDENGGSGLGYYDIMSGGTWAQKRIDTYPGQTPTQYTAHTKIDAGFTSGVTEVNSTQEVTIKCSSTQMVKLTTLKANEYFLLACRDSGRIDSDRSFEALDSRFTDNKLFALLYHIDSDKYQEMLQENKLVNSEDGVQTESNHYSVALVEKNKYPLMSNRSRIEVDYSDVYGVGDTINRSSTKLYDGHETGYRVIVESADYTHRTMRFKIIN